MGRVTSALAVLIVAGIASAQTVVVIDGTGNTVPTYSNTSDTNITWNQTVGGLGAAVFDTLGVRNSAVTIASGGIRPLLSDNTVFSAELYVSALDVSDCSQGENRIKLTFRNPADGVQDSQWAGTAGGAGGAGLQWFPTEVDTWTTFNYDLTQESWWSNDYSTWEIYRVYFYENDDPDYQNSFAIRNLQFTTASTPDPVLLGDANNDGVVSADDFAAVQTNFGNTGDADGLLPGDANDDGVVSADDFAAIQTNFGNVLGAAAEAAPVPEPATMALLAITGLAATFRGRRRA